MAIQKSKTLTNGSQGNYWKITNITVDKLSYKATYTISLFMDEAHHNSVPLGCSKVYSFPLSGTDAESNLLAFGYTNIKVKASTVAPPIFNPRGTPVTFDPDLAGGTDV